ncbi:MAG: hypothetical protein GXW99_01150 [Clostridiales bacterium]|nr:hypothetical protein [Clostridiales bacterium]
MPKADLIRGWKKYYGEYNKQMRLNSANQMEVNRKKHFREIAEIINCPRAGKYCNLVDCEACARKKAIETPLGLPLP